MNSLKIACWDVEQFKNSQEEWSNLLVKSNSNKLFMSWEWLYTWWDIFSDPKSMELKLFVAINENGDVVGIAPLYLSTVISKRFVKTRRLQFLGNCWRGNVTMRTELQDFIVNKSCAEQVISSFYQFMNSLPDWDELILSDLDMKSDTYNVLINEKPINNAYYRYAETYDSFYLNIVKSFDEFCQSLGTNTRLKLLNRRKVLDTLGEVKFIECVENNIEDSFSKLNELHIKRWGTPVFKDKRLDFNLTVAQLMAKKDMLRFSLITLDDKPISIQYNYLINKHEYNIQAGFEEEFHKKISLGYLHFGYEIESAFENNIEVYDFLAGEGKNTQYKERLTSSTIKIVCMQVVRKKSVKILYYIYDWYCRTLKKSN